MPDPATPAPPPAACLGAIEREVRRHWIIERALRGWSAGTIGEAEDLGCAKSPDGRSSCARVDPARAHVRLQTARLDERANRADGDKARAAAARGGRTAARRRAPRGLQFACNPLILLDRPQNVFPNVSKPKGFVGRRGSGRRRAPRAGRRRAADPRGFQFACNPLICLDRTRNPFPNVSTTKGFVGRGGAQTPIWVVEAPEAGGGGRRARG